MDVPVADRTSNPDDDAERKPSTRPGLVCRARRCALLAVEGVWCRGHERLGKPVVEQPVWALALPRSHRRHAQRRLADPSRHATGHRTNVATTPGRRPRTRCRRRTCRTMIQTPATPINRRAGSSTGVRRCRRRHAASTAGYAWPAPCAGTSRRSPSKPPNYVRGAVVGTPWKDADRRVERVPSGGRPVRS